MKNSPIPEEYHGPDGRIDIPVVMAAKVTGGVVAGTIITLLGPLGALAFTAAAITAICKTQPARESPD